MINAEIYTDIAKRTNGELFVGVVGPVRTGKSTFIKRFAEQMMLPHIENEYDAQRTAYLQGIGCRVLRYANNAVDTNFAGVCEDILHNIG